MSAFSDYMENKILLWSFKNQQMPTPFAFVYISLHHGSPGEATAGTNEITNAAGGNYARATVSTTGTDWTVNANQVQNASVIVFPSTGTITGWLGSGGSTTPTISHFAINSALTGGEILYYGALSASKTVSAGDIFQFGALGITIQLA